MALFLTIVALVGLLIFGVGAVLFLVNRPARPLNVTLMVVGGLVWAVATIIATFIAIL